MPHTPNSRASPHAKYVAIRKILPVRESAEVKLPRQLTYNKTIAEFRNSVLSRLTNDTKYIDNLMLVLESREYFTTLEKDEGILNRIFKVASNLQQVWPTTMSSFFQLMAKDTDHTNCSLWLKINSDTIACLISHMVLNTIVGPNPIRRLIMSERLSISQKSNLLEFILSYLNSAYEEMFDISRTRQTKRVLRFERSSLRNSNASPSGFTKIKYHRADHVQKHGNDCTLVEILNENWFESGSSLFLNYPEVLVTFLMLDCDSLRHDEAIVVRGLKRYCENHDYVPLLDYKCATMDDISNNIEMVLQSPSRGNGAEQNAGDVVLSEYNRYRAAFSLSNNSILVTRPFSVDSHGIQQSILLQIVAASNCGCSQMIIYSMGSDVHDEQSQKVESLLHDLKYAKYGTPTNVFRCVDNFQKNQRVTLFEYVHFMITRG